MRSVVFVVGLAAACSGPNKSARSSPGVLLGRVPTTSSYRVIACALGPDQRRACEGMLAPLVGTAVRDLDGKVAKVARVGVLPSAGDGDVPAIDLDPPLGAAAVTGSAALLRTTATLTEADTSALRRQVRAISPRARWATAERFEVHALAADLDGDQRPDRVAVGTIVDDGADGARVVVGIAVGLAGTPLELVELAADRVQLLGTIDLDGDGRDEVLIDRTHGGTAIRYRYELVHARAGKRLAIDLAQPAPVSEGWQPYDLLEDHDRTDEL